MKLKILFGGLVVFLGIAVAGISFFFFDSCTNEEVVRALSPEGDLEVVVSKKDCGATTSEVYSVFLAPKGGKVRKENNVAILDKVENLQATWMDKDTVLLSYDSARIFHFTNFWQYSITSGVSHIISINEKKNTL